MNILIPTLLLILLLGNITTGQTPEKYSYEWRIADIRARFGYDERDRIWAASKCPILARNVNYEQDSRRQQPNARVELGHKFLKIQPSVGPCIPK